MRIKKLSIPKNERSRQMLCLTFLVAIVVVIVFCFDSWSSYKVEIKSSEIQVNNLTQVLEEQIVSSFKRIDLALLFLQDEMDGGAKKFNTREMNELLKLQLMRHSELLSIKIVDKNGEFIADDTGKLSNLNIRDREYFQYLKKIEKDELVISKPVISKTTRRWVIVLSRPVLSVDGHFNGLILATIPLDNLVVSFSQINLGKEGSLTLFHEDETIYVRYPHPEKYIGMKKVMTKKTLDFFHSKEKFSTYSNISGIDGVERIISAHRIGEFPLIIVAGMATNEFLAPWKIRTVVYIAILVGLMIFFTFFLAKFLKTIEEIEDQRKQAVQSAKLSSLGEMASGIAHEINNPLTIISSTAYLMRKTNSLSEEDEKHNRNVERIISTVDRIAKIVRGLKTFARDSYNDPMQISTGEKIITAAMEMCSEKMKNRGIHIEINLESDADFLCKETQLVQVIMNLISNSVDALEGQFDKKIFVTLERTEDHKLRIIVKDSGPKIPAHIAEKIMQPFFTTKEVGKGTGLGLSISKGIVEAHKGKFYLDRSAAMTTFVVELPTVAEQKKAA